MSYRGSYWHMYPVGKDDKDESELHIGIGFVMFGKCRILYVRLENS